MLRTAVWIILLAFVLWVLGAWAANAQSLGYGVTCDHVRKLTVIERKYWIWRLGLSQEQVNTIRKLCRK